MNTMVKEFLDKKKREINKSNYEKKSKLLISLGLYEKAYSPQNTSSAEYPFYERDKVDKKDKFYKKVPIDVTDEEFEEIKKVCKTDTTSSGNSANTVATVLIFFAVLIFIGGFITGSVLGNTEVTKGTYYTYTKTEFSFAIALTYWSISLISGMLLIAFAEIIKLLTAIKNK